MHAETEINKDVKRRPSYISYQSVSPINMSLRNLYLHAAVPGMQYQVQSPLNDIEFVLNEDFPRIPRRTLCYAHNPNLF